MFIMMCILKKKAIHEGQQQYIEFQNRLLTRQTVIYFCSGTQD